MRFQRGGSIMTTSYYADRINLLYVLQQHPDWTQPKLAQALGRSLAWVKKWLRRIRQVQRLTVVDNSNISPNRLTAW
jgi:hypothetical protein